MDPLLFKVTEKEGSSFHVQENKNKALYGNLHYHPEMQISFILEGNGITSVGNSFEPFQKGDLFLIGPNVPHVIKNPYGTEMEESSHIVSVFFKEDSFGNQFFFLPEMQQIRSFLNATKRGLKLNSSYAQPFFKIIQELTTAKGADRLIALLNMIHAFSKNRNWKYLSSIGYTTPPRKEFYNSMNRIFKYISNNFDKPIALEEVAKLANLSKYSFCRYFKKITHKSFITYLNEYRVGVACRLLNSSNYTISQVGFETGFNNLSNFNRQFKRIMKCTPSKYRALYKKYFGLEENE